MSSTALAPSRGATTTKQKVGLVICALYSLANIPSFLEQQPDGEEGPPLAILIIGSVLGVIGLVAAIMAWRGNRVALRVGAGAIIVVTLTGLPAFFVDVPMAIKALVVSSVIITVVSVVLMFSGDRRLAAVSD
jgi:energy-converting hydrogenase Eha subunit B